MRVVWDQNPRTRGRTSNQLAFSCEPSESIPHFFIVVDLVHTLCDFTNGIDALCLKRLQRRLGRHLQFHLVVSQVFERLSCLTVTIFRTHLHVYNSMSCSAVNFLWCLIVFSIEQVAVVWSERLSEELRQVAQPKYVHVLHRRAHVLPPTCLILLTIHLLSYFRIISQSDLRLLKRGWMILI